MRPRIANRLFWVNAYYFKTYSECVNRGPYWSRPVLESISRLMVNFESFCTRTAMVHSFRQFGIPVQLAVNLDFCSVSTAILRNHDCAAELYLGHQGRPDHDSKGCCRPLTSRLLILGHIEAVRRQCYQLLKVLTAPNNSGRDQ